MVKLEEEQEQNPLDLSRLKESGKNKISKPNLTENHYLKSTTVY